jgi:hypothetical protein
VEQIVAASDQGLEAACRRNPGRARRILVQGQCQQPIGDPAGGPLCERF